MSSCPAWYHATNSSIIGRDTPKNSSNLLQVAASISAVVVFNGPGQKSFPLDLKVTAANFNCPFTSLPPIHNDPAKIEVYLGSSLVICFRTLYPAILLDLSSHLLPPGPSTLARTLFNSKVAIAVADAHPAVGVGFPPPFLFVPGATSRALNVNRLNVVIANKVKVNCFFILYIV